MNYTPKQLEILRMIKQSQQERGYSPTFAEIAKVMGVSSVTIFEHVQALEKKGAITRRKYAARSIEIVDAAFDPTSEDTPTLREAVRELLEHAIIIERQYTDRFKTSASDDYAIPITLGQIRRIHDALLTS